MKRILASLAVLGLMVGAAQAQVNKTMAVSVPTADHGWTGGVVFHAMEEAKALEKKYPGLKVIVKTSPDPAAQADALEDLSTQGIDALVVLPHDPNVLTDPIRKVKNKGTFVTVVDRIADDRSIYDLYVGGDNPGLGASAAQFFKKAMPNGGDIVVIRGLPIPIDKMRVDAFNDGIKGAKINVIDSQFGNWSRDDAFKVMQDFLTKHPKIDAVWCQDDDMAIGVFEAFLRLSRITPVMSRVRPFTTMRCGLSRLVPRIVPPVVRIPESVERSSSSRRFLDQPPKPVAETHDLHAVEAHRSLAHATDRRVQAGTVPAGRQNANTLRF